MNKTGKKRHAHNVQDEELEVQALRDEEELDTQFLEIQKELGHLSKKQLLMLIMVEREKATNFSSGLKARYWTHEALKEQILRSEQGKQVRAEGRRDQILSIGKAHKASKNLGVTDFYKFMVQVVYLLDDPRYVAHQNEKIETKRARLIAFDLCTKNGYSSLTHNNEEWGELLKENIRSGSIRTAREHVEKKVYKP